MRSNLRNRYWGHRDTGEGIQGRGYRGQKFFPIPAGGFRQRVLPRYRCTGEVFSDPGNILKLQTLSS